MKSKWTLFARGSLLLGLLLAASACETPTVPPIEKEEEEDGDPDEGIRASHTALHITFEPTRLSGV